LTAAALVALAVAGFLVLRPSANRTAAPPAASRDTTRPARGHPTHVRHVARLELRFPLPQRTVVVPILMYHLIGTTDPSTPSITRALTVATSVFAAQMRWLKRAGFHAITQEQLFAALEDGAPLPSHPIVITFDDGYRDVLWNASPILVHLHMPATAYVITGRLSGPDPSFLTWPELRLLEQRGFDIGSHTVHHLELTLLPPSEAAYELVASRRALEQRLGHPVQWFAYPAGRENAQVVQLVQRAGYVDAVTTQPGDVQAASDPFRLHRIEVLHTTGVRGLAALLSWSIRAGKA
jgi:peptidoglycan/xylan/chitin deacetylase (PgdA/CDA1 family)